MALFESFRMAVRVGYQVLRLGFRSVASIILWSAAVILGLELGHFFSEGPSDVGQFFKKVLSRDLLNAEKAAGLVIGVGAGMSFFILFLAWKRRHDFFSALKATLGWIWLSGMGQMRRLVIALSKQLAIYTGLFFAIFVFVPKENDPPKPGPTLPLTAAQLQSYRNQLIEVIDVKLPLLISVIEVKIKDLREQLIALQRAVDGRSGVVVYLDKSADLAKPDQSEFQLIYVALFENASFESDSKVGRKLSFGESKRLEKFAKSLLQIAETLRIAGNKAGRLKIDVRGFASDAPKNLSAKEKDEKNNEVANDRARSVYEVLFEALKDTVDMPPPVPWEKSGLEMHKKRQFNDGPVQRPSSEDTARAEAPNRRVEILVTLPPVLRVSRVSDDITRENVSQR
jgi:hypothetical protein